ncbi:hypothetical protein [Mesorhizobium sp. M0816]|uniref:hypothetical protein n=1 Tax=Mesorhizobium sp. M0816 TaxID=2957006 RepID=UPI00333C0230
MPVLLRWSQLLAKKISRRIETAKMSGNRKRLSIDKLPALSQFDLLESALAFKAEQARGGDPRQRDVVSNAGDRLRAAQAQLPERQPWRSICFAPLPALQLDGAVVRFHNPGHEPTEPAFRPPRGYASAQDLTWRATRNAVQGARNIAKGGHRRLQGIAENMRS